MKAILLMIFVFATTIAVAQDGLPANPNPGKCYVKCVTHDEFKTETETVEIQAAYKVLKVIPATFKWVEEKVLVKEASKKMIYHPAEYKWEEVAYVKKEEEKVLSVVPATFNKESKTIEIFPKTGAWKYTAYADCASPNPEDCQTLCYIEKPAQYTDVPTSPLAADASTTEDLKPKKDASYKKQVIAKEAWVEEIEIPAVYSTIKRQVIDVPAKTVEEIVPAKTKTVSKEVLTKKGGINTWEEIDCGLVKPNTLNILWDLNSANLRGATRKEIDNVLLSLLNEKPNISIELTSHTDSRGSDEFNRALSQRRADAVKNYLVSKGVSESRITSKGYGETRLLNNCSNGVRCSAAQHQTNRRTEYRVIGQQ
jgi:outer membrane protein OmpA-like peptidoglycan-associated protein